MNTDTDLLLVRKASCLPRLLPGLGEDRKKYRRKDRYYSDNNEQFNESKPQTSAI